MLSQLDCFRATVAHEAHNEFLFYMSFTPDIERRIREEYKLTYEDDIRDYFETHFGMYNPRPIGPKKPDNYSSPDFSVYYQDLTIPENAFINPLGVLKIPGSMYHFSRFISPLRNAENFSDLESFPYPSVEGYSSENMASEVKQAHMNGKVASSWVGHMYEDSWQIRGYEQFLMDMLIRPEWCEFILDKITAKNLDVATAAAKAGVDVIRTGDDVANQQTMMFSPEQWRKFMKPRWAKVYAEARSVKPDIEIWYHSDGNIADIIPDLIEIGVTILNPVQPECLDPLEIKKKYGDKIVIDGTIGTQTTMPFGSPQEVKNIIKERIKTLGYDGALIISPTHVLEPEVPLDNIQAFINTAKSHF